MHIPVRAFGNQYAQRDQKQQGTADIDHRFPAGRELVIKNIDPDMTVFFEGKSHTEQEDYGKQVPLHLLHGDRSGVKEVTHDRIVENIEEHDQVQESSDPSHDVGKTIEELFQF